MTRNSDAVTGSDLTAETTEAQTSVMPRGVQDIEGFGFAVNETAELEENDD